MPFSFRSGFIRLLTVSFLLMFCCQAFSGAEKFRTPKFRVIAFYKAEMIRDISALFTKLTGGSQKWQLHVILHMIPQTTGII
jgi:hypothetical protein